MTVEDHALAGGFGSAVLELLAERAPGTRVRRLGLPDRFVEHGEQDAQWREAGIDAESIAAARCVRSCAACGPRARVGRGGRAIERRARRRAVAAAYAHCAEIARRSGSSFARGVLDVPARAAPRAARDLRVLPARRRHRRRSRRCAATAAMLLERWHEELVDAYRGKARASGRASRSATRCSASGCPSRCFLDLLRGVEADLRGARDRDLRGARALLLLRRVDDRPARVRRARARGAARARLRREARHRGAAHERAARRRARTPRAGRIYLAREDLERMRRDRPRRSREGEMTRGRSRLLLALYAERARISLRRRRQRALPARSGAAPAPRARRWARIYRELLEELAATRLPGLGPGAAALEAAPRRDRGARVLARAHRRRRAVSEIAARASSAHLDLCATRRRRVRALDAARGGAPAPRGAARARRSTRSIRRSSCSAGASRRRS